MENNNQFHNDYYYYDIVRKNIKKYRKTANLTQQELADRVDVSMHYISQIESARPNKYFTLVGEFSKINLTILVSIWSYNKTPFF